MRLLEARVHAIEWLCDGVIGIDLRPCAMENWPVVTAGAHIDLLLPNGLTRSYSLTNRPGEAHRYTVAVAMDAASRGGSIFVHNNLKVGQKISISAPRNHFPVDESTSHSVFIAGGIGITPIWCMVQRLSQIGSSWEIHYSARARVNAAFVDEVVTLAEQTGNVVHLNFDGGVRERMLDINSLVASQESGTHLYSCGPAPMLKAFDQACQGRDPATVHREYFAAPVSSNADATTDEEIELVLSRTNIRIKVDEKTSILDAVLAAGVDVPYSCMSGLCRACETPVLSGTPDHRDLVLTDAERNSGTTMMICCSRSKSRELVLDLKPAGATPAWRHGNYASKWIDTALFAWILRCSEAGMRGITPRHDSRPFSRPSD